MVIAYFLSETSFGDLHNFEQSRVTSSEDDVGLFVPADGDSLDEFLGGDLVAFGVNPDLVLNDVAGLGNDFIGLVLGLKINQSN
jgi:hypothetical protein